MGSIRGKAYPLPQAHMVTVSAPMKRYALGFICLQGGGLYIVGTATLTNTNVYSNTAERVRARLSNLPRPFLHRPMERYTCALFLAGQRHLHRI